MITRTLVIIFTCLIWYPLFGQESDMLGEDFDLEALPGILQEVNTFEELEKAINDSTSDINNLDLDQNGEVDYVLIHEYEDGDSHVAFLRVAMSEDEYQDIASIEMEKQSATTASFQIVGNEKLYGEDYILEPEGGLVDISQNADASGGKGSPSPKPEPGPPPAVRITICVGVYTPGYVAYVSPYGFVLRPVWFRPWSPMARSTFKKRSARWHRSQFKRTSHRRSAHCRNMQKQHKKSSKKASHRTATTQGNMKSSQQKGKQQSPAAKGNQKTNTKPKSNTQKKGAANKNKRK